MTTIAVAQTLALGLTLLALLAAAFVLGREASRRLRTRAAMRRLDAARRVLDASAPESVKDLAAKLRKHFDRVTVERAVELLLNDDHAGRSARSCSARSGWSTATRSVCARHAPGPSERTPRRSSVGRDAPRPFLRSCSCCAIPTKTRP